jgi:sigma-54 dependent transcriptional regulator of gfr operon
LIAHELFKRRDTLQNGQIATELLKDIGISLGKTLSPVGILDLYICVASFTPQIDKRQTIGIILAHGYSTASSMAATANHLLGSHIYDAIDMPTDVRPMVIAQKLSAYMQSLSGVKDVILLVDMGSLEDIYKNIDNISNVNLGVIGDVTMKMTLSVGTDIQKGLPIQTVVDKHRDLPTKHEGIFLENRKKSTAILSVCATGMGTAEKISDLLKQSLPAGIDLQVIPYNYGSLASAGIHSPVFEKYNVIFIVGTHDPKVPGCLFISLEDIIQQYNAGDINRLLAKILSKDELLKFNESLIKNFSLTNLVGHLTILNPEKVMDFAENIIKELQAKTGVAFKNKTIVGLYIHICCLVERLITDRYMVTYESLEDFEKKNVEFIKIVRDSFRDVEKYYGVGIPVAEIGYLYEYIYNL